jgi:uncharacterized protein
MAISAVAVCRNAISNTHSTSPKTFEPLFERKPNGEIDAGPWCEGFYTAMQLRPSAWAPRRNLADINHALLSPILLHCVDDQGHPLLGPSREGPESALFLKAAYKDIPDVVEAIRQYWMPIRFKNR